MTRHGTHFGDSTDARSPFGEERETPDRREIILMSTGAHAFAVYAEEADGVTRDLKATPLPGAPRAVAGVVCVRGRMRTVLDPLALLPSTANETGEGANDDDGQETAAFVVTLRGDEQLALAVGQVVGIFELQAEALDAGGEQTAPAVRATLRHDGRPVTLLDPANLFEAALRGTERRRQRLKEVTGK